MENLKEIKLTELQSISGGTFGYDVGWLINYAWDCIAGTTVDEVVDFATYYAHYNQ